MWPTSEGYAGFLMKSRSSGINVLIHFLLPPSTLGFPFFRITSRPSPFLFSIHFLCKSPEHLFGRVMGAQLSRCFPNEAANNLLCGL